MPTLSWMVGDLGGGVTIHTASVTSVAPGACDHIGSACSLVAYPHCVLCARPCRDLSLCMLGLESP